MLVFVNCSNLVDYHDEEYKYSNDRLFSLFNKENVSYFAAKLKIEYGSAKIRIITSPYRSPYRIGEILAKEFFNDIPEKILTNRFLIDADLSDLFIRPSAKESLHPETLLFNPLMENEYKSFLMRAALYRRRLAIIYETISYYIGDN